jgi:ATP-binding cassette, subfamily B, multidrug efflux pump
METSAYLDRKLLWRVIRYAFPYRKLFVITLILAVVLAPVSIATPLLINIMVDRFIVGGIDIDGLTLWTMFLIGAVLLHAAFEYAFIFTTNLLGQLVIKDMRVQVFQHIIGLNLRHFDLTPIGTSTTRTINDIESINNIFKEGIITIVADLLAIIVVLITMFTISIKLTIICLITMPLMILASYWFKESVKKAFQTVRTQIQRMNAFLQERITGMRIVQIFQAEKQEMDKFRKINREYTQANLDSIFAYAVFFPVVEILSAVSLGLMVWWGAQGGTRRQRDTGCLDRFPAVPQPAFQTDSGDSG